MILLVLSVVLSFVSFHHSALVEDSPDLQFFLYHNKIRILYKLLAEECPDYLQQKREVTDLQKVKLDTQASLMQHLEQELVRCRQSELISTTTTDSVTNPTPLCPSYDGDSVFDIRFISYNNPTNGKAPGVLCRTDGSPCSISLKICVSVINSTNCEYYYSVTDVVVEKSKIDLIDNLGNLKNPVKINLGDRKWQGAHVQVTVVHKNLPSAHRINDKVDEFSYDLTDVQGSVHRLLTLHGKRATDKTELVVMLTVPCPSPSTTLPTTQSTILPTTPTTTLPTTTTSPPVPAECLTATNLTQSWRLYHNGSAIKGGGPSSVNGYACDRYGDMGWFRFSGAAGTHMLDTCPKSRSCGTYYPLWSDWTPPQAVGVTANMNAYAVLGVDCKYHPRHMQVMRCSLSTDHDLIYRDTAPYVTGQTTCWYAFCGMN